MQDSRPHYTRPVASIEAQDCAQLILLALEEDAPQGDPSSEAITEDIHTQGQAYVLAKEEGLICGLSLLPTLFQLEKERQGNLISYRSGFQDGQKIKKGDIVLKMKGSLRSILRLERVILNFLQYLSGISTQVNKLVKAAGSGIVILDTRKTLPGFRRLAKYAVYYGGGTNHRIHLSDMAMLKDNHIAAAGSITKAVAAVRQKFSDLPIKIEVEVGNLRQFEEALGLDVDMILLDNMDKKGLVAAGKKIRARKEKDENRPFLEISGNWTPARIEQLKNLGLNQIFQRKQIGVSMGALTHSSSFLDLSMRVEGLAQKKKDKK